MAAAEYTYSEAAKTISLALEMKKSRLNGVPSR
jgi:hypothetical protein